MALKNLYGGNVLVSSLGMHEMTGRITCVLNQTKNNFLHIKADHIRFANGEIKPFLPQTVRGTHVFLLHALQEPDPNIALMTLLLTADALKRASATGITLVLPYIPYLRQDRKDEPRVPISARLIADLIESNNKVDRIITIDMHTDQEQGFFSIPVDNIKALKVHANYFKKRFNNNFSNVVVVAPDFGSSTRAERFIQLLGCNEEQIAIIRKHRSCPNQSAPTGIIGADVKDKTVIIYDDMIDTGGTNRGAVAEIMKRGALEVYTCVTHGIFSGGAEVKFRKEGRPVIATQSIPRTTEYQSGNSSWLSFVPIEDLLAEAIHEASIVGGSFSKL